jgi:hypothetical protein
LELAVLQDAERLKTSAAILRGEMTLPSPSDARTWLDRLTGRVPMTDKEREQSAQIDALHERVKALEQPKPAPEGA